MNDNFEMDEKHQLQQRLPSSHLYQQSEAQTLQCEDIAFCHRVERLCSVRGITHNSNCPKLPEAAYNLYGVIKLK
jgi:hypothetical protein